jgi:hypothetical protein
MAHNEVRGNGLCNIGAMDHAIVWCQDSSITDSPGVGLLLLGSSSGSCRYNHISGNAKAGVRCTGETRVTVEHNRVHGTSRGNGITIDGRTTVRVHKNVVDGNQGCALSAGDRCAPTVSSNVLVCGSGPHASALLLSGRAGGRLRDNTVQVAPLTPAPLSPPWPHFIRPSSAWSAAAGLLVCLVGPASEATDQRLPPTAGV